MEFESVFQLLVENFQKYQIRFALRVNRQPIRDSVGNEKKMLYTVHFAVGILEISVEYVMRLAAKEKLSLFRHLGSVGRRPVARIREACENDA